jgi:hypothetical protein
MRRILRVWVIASGAVVGFAPGAPSANAQAISLPAGSMEWQYECPAGAQCLTTCSIKGNQIFTTADYATLTIIRLPHQGYWLRIDTGDKTVEWILEGEQPLCSIAGATLKASRAWESASPQPSKPQ